MWKRRESKKGGREVQQGGRKRKGKAIKMYKERESMKCEVEGEQGERRDEEEERCTRRGRTGKVESAWSAKGCSGKPWRECGHAVMKELRRLDLRARSSMHHIVRSKVPPTTNINMPLSNPVVGPPAIDSLRWEKFSRVWAGIHHSGSAIQQCGGGDTVGWD